MGKVKKNIKLSEHKHVAVTLFKSKPYFHVNDIRKNKSVTFNKEDLQAFIKNGAKILEVGVKLKKRAGSHKNKAKEKKESKKSKREDDTSSSSESGSDDTGSANESDD